MYTGLFWCTSAVPFAAHVFLFIWVLQPHLTLNIYNPYFNYLTDLYTKMGPTKAVIQLVDEFEPLDLAVAHS